MKKVSLSNSLKSLYRSLRGPGIMLTLMLAAGFVILQIAQGSAAVQPAATPAPAPAPSAEKAANYGNLVSIVPNFDPKTDKYVLTAWSRQGMQHVSDAEGMWTLLSPGNVLEAQLIKRGSGPSVQTAGVTISYRLENELMPAIDPAKPAAVSPAASTGPQLTGSNNGLAKAPYQVSGVLRPAPDGKSFVSSPIPLLPYTADGDFLPYPLAVVEAKDKDGKLLAYTRVVLPVSTELGCKSCHGGEWSKNDVAGISKETARNILAAHDRNHGTKLVEKADAAEQVRLQGKGGVESYGVNCKTCHNDITKGRLNMSTSIHSFHVDKMGERKDGETCASCHPSQKIPPVNPDGDSATNFMRDVHSVKAMNCTACHGSLENLSISLLLQAKNEGKLHADALLAGIKATPAPNAQSAADIKPRKAWMNEPDCYACHDFAKKPKAHGLSAFNKNVASEDKLFSRSLDAAQSVRCASCHGSPHALYPATNMYSPDRDNIQPLQYQKNPRNLGADGNCQVCHLDKPTNAVHHEKSIVKTDAAVITMPADARRGMPKVKFSHDAHAAILCGDCHHADRGDDDSGLTHANAQGAKQRCASSGCHDGVNYNQAKPYQFFFTAFHGPEKGCLSCHLDLQAKGEISGPTTCLACHVQKS